MHRLRLPVSALLAFLVLAGGDASAAGMLEDLGLRAVGDIVTETIAINRFGSMCSLVGTAASSIKSVTSTSSFHRASTSSTGFHYTTTTMTDSTALPTHSSSSAAVSTTPSPLPYSTGTHCSDPGCPLLDHDACLSVAGSTYGVICDSGLTGLVAFPPSKRQKRKYTPSFTTCLDLCDEFGAGCHGASWTAQADEGGNCLIYGGVTGVSAQDGTIAARRLATYGGAGAYGIGSYGGGAAYGGGAYGS